MAVPSRALTDWITPRLDGDSWPDFTNLPGQNSQSSRCLRGIKSVECSQSERVPSCHCTFTWVLVAVIKHTSASVPSHPAIASTSCSSSGRVLEGMTGSVLAATAAAAAFCCFTFNACLAFGFFLMWGWMFKTVCDKKWDRMVGWIIA